MSTLRTDTLSNAAGTSSVPVNTVVNGTAKAWVNFNGTGVVAIRQGFNVTSITDNAVGDYTVNFTTAMANANYCYVASTKRTSTGETLSVMESVTVAPTTSAFRLVISTGDTNASMDSSAVCVAIFS